MNMNLNSFIRKENMTSVCEITITSNLPQTFYEHFMQYDDEVIYVLKEGKMFGVVSIGDLERFYKYELYELQINMKYSSLQTIDYDAADYFFRQTKTVNEIPIVTINNDLMGVIRRNKKRELRTQQKKSLQSVRKYAWQRNEIKRFIDETKANVFLYTFSGSEVMDSLKKKEFDVLRRRENNDDISLWRGMEEEEWKIFWGDAYENGIVDNMRLELGHLVLNTVNGISSPTDVSGACYSFKNGYRVTPNNPLEAKRKIVMYGPCIIAGAYCKDNQTISSYLQQFLIENGYKEWKVLNRGLCDQEYCYGHMFLEELSENDIAIIWCMDGWTPINIPNKLTLQGDLTNSFLSMPSLADNLIDHPLHCNYRVNWELARKIYADICLTRIFEKPQTSRVAERIQDYYIPWNIHEYFTNYFRRYGLHKEDNEMNVGAVVMNCNPFTKGHRYLIEQAIQYVDKLLVFVVEEDSSYFKFINRMKMVETGVLDLSNVQVVPSGKYILSNETFAQYFNKEQIQNVESMDYDIDIFGEVVASGLGIKYRFVGEEPFDKVTREYNEKMKRILPHFNVKVVEIPRMQDAEYGIVSASLVRKALKEKNYEIIEKICPESTIAYLRSMRQEEYGYEN